jgi:hypothetical protein
MPGDRDVTPAIRVELVPRAERFVVCEKCGAAILLDPRLQHDPIEVHARWHTDRENTTAGIGFVALVALLLATAVLLL